MEQEIAAFGAAIGQKLAEGWSEVKEIVLPSSEFRVAVYAIIGIVLVGMVTPWAIERGIRLVRFLWMLRHHFAFRRHED